MWKLWFLAINKYHPSDIKTFSTCKMSEIELLHLMCDLNKKESIFFIAH